MKGRRKEMIGMNYTNNFAKALAYQPYNNGMTELLSQAYSLGEGVFECSWIQILIRDTEDALTYIQQQAESM
jgi:hypothetical protein